MDIIIKINTDNEAFTDNETQVMKEIISSQINRIDVQDFVYLYDINGNKVGTVEKVDCLADYYKAIYDDKIFAQQFEYMFGDNDYPTKIRQEE